MEKTPEHWLWKSLEREMQVTAVHCCVLIFSQAIAGLPLHLYRYTDDVEKKRLLIIPCIVALIMAFTMRSVMRYMAAYTGEQEGSFRYKSKYKTRRHELNSSIYFDLINQEKNLKIA